MKEPVLGSCCDLFIILYFCKVGHAATGLFKACTSNMKNFEHMASSFSQNLFVPIVWCCLVFDNYYSTIGSIKTMEERFIELAGVATLLCLRWLNSLSI